MTARTMPLRPVVILAGGLATRLGETARTVPKCLLDVAGEPFLFHQLRRLKAEGIESVLLCVSHLGEQVVAAAGDGSAFGLHLDYAFDGPVRAGTAGAIKRVLPRLPDEFFVLYGDSLLTCPFAPVQAAFLSSDAAALMTVYRNDGQWDASNVEFVAGRILAYDKVHRTSRMKHIDYGLGLFRQHAFDHVPVDLPHDLAEVYQRALRDGRLAGREVGERFYEIGSHAGLQETREYLGAQGGAASDGLIPASNRPPQQPAHPFSTFLDPPTSEARPR